MLPFRFTWLYETMKRPIVRLSPHGLAAAACLFFFVAGQAFIPRLGVQDDEAFFGNAFLQPRTGVAIQIGHSRLPIMLMSYLGTLKAWVYRPIFSVFGTSIWSLREPVLVAGVASIWIFYLLLRRIAGARAAVIGCGLLAVDSMYLLTVCFDWGPVALQHLLLLGGLLLLLRFYHHGAWCPLAGGSFLLGLAMWDKALAVCMLGGIAVAGLAVLSAQIWRVTAFRRVAISVLFFVLGALPLIVYNARNHLATFRGQTYSAREIPIKATMLMKTARGVGLFGWLVNDDGHTPEPHAPHTALERASLALSAAAKHPRENLLPYAFVLALLLTPLCRGGELRAILFALIVMTVQWMQMALTVGAGTGVHHTILLWPFPLVVIAVSFASASRRLGRAGLPVAAGILAVMLASGGLQMNEYYRLAWRNGGGRNWSDAVFRLSDYMKGVHARQIFCVDWSIIDGLRLLHHGRLPLYIVFDTVPPDGGSPDMRRIREAVSQPDRVFIAHVPGAENFEGSNARLVKAARNAGYSPETLALISDSYGRPVYEVYHFMGATVEQRLAPAIWSPVKAP
jgi:4-amino-4-deoxy-L-arabinose transferase-like glycosyltransferase